MNIEVKRVYGQSGQTPGHRVLVDRLWPRGVAKDKLRPDEWLTDLAPTTELRKWFGHDPARWEVFRARYLDELKAKSVELQRLREIARKKTLVLLYAAKDEEHNHALVIRDALLENA